MHLLTVSLMNSIMLLALVSLFVCLSKFRVLNFQYENTFDLDRLVRLAAIAKKTQVGVFINQQRIVEPVCCFNRKKRF